jgi:hypothetical protein
MHCSLTRGEQNGSRPNARSRSCDGIPPLVRCLGSEDAERRARDEVPLKIEGVVDSGVEAEKPWAERADLRRFTLRCRRRSG